MRSSTAGSTTEHAELVDANGVQIAPLHYPHLTHTEIFQSVEEFYRRFYFRAPKIAAIVSEMVRSPEMMVRRLREGVEFFCLPARAAGVGSLNHLIITADDFGLSEHVNAAVEEAHRRGVLSAASLMVGAPAAADAVERARRLPNLRVGLHVVLVDGDPVSERAHIPALVDRSGRLRNDLPRYGAALAMSPAARRQAAKEIAAQFEAFRATGLPLDHVNAHRHFHLHPVVAASIMTHRPALRHARAARPGRALAHRRGNRSADVAADRPRRRARGPHGCGGTPAAPG